MNLFGKKKSTGGFMNQIRCDELSYLIWKWHPPGSQPGNNNRENAIRWGSSLRVKDGEVAVFVYDQDNGVTQDFIEGPFDQILETVNLPIIANIVGLAYGGGTPFQAEVYFINLARIIQVKFGVPFFDVYDPRFLDFGVPVAVRGTISFKIDDYREFIKIHRLCRFSLDDLEKQIRDTVSRYVKDAVANAPAAHNIPVIQIESRTAQINDAIEDNIAARLKKNFGITVTGVDIGAIEIDKTSNEYARLMAVTQRVTAAKVRAQADADVRNIHDKQRVDAENYEETLRFQREESRYAQHKQTQTANFAAFQTEKQAEVGVAGANAFGKMNTNGAGNVNMDGSGMGFNPAAVAAGMAIGGTVGQNIAGAMNNAMSGMNQPPTPGMIPPPIPVAVYHVAINGYATGPYDIATLTHMVAVGALTEDSLVWKQGMTDWAAASAMPDLQSILNPTPPPVPPRK